MEPDQIQQLISQLQSGNDQERRDAAEKLGKSKDPAAVQALINAQKDPDDSVRQKAVDGLRSGATPEALSYLTSIGAPKVARKYALWGWIPILAALFSCGLIGFIGIMLASANDFAGDPGRVIGTVAFIVSLVVFLVVKKLINDKIKASQSSAPKDKPEHPDK